MIRTIPPFLLIALYAQGNPQHLLLDRLYSPSFPIDTSTLFWINQQASTSEIMAHVGFIASDPLQGREAGTPYEKITATYLVMQHNRFQHLPLLPQGYIHRFPLRRERSNPSPPPSDTKKRNRKMPTTPPVLFDTVEAWNVLAQRRGSVFPSQYVILSAHYDHIGTTSKGEVYNGADDNGSGTAVLLEVARLLSLLPPPKRTIVFFHTAAEEKGLLGAFRFVRDSLLPLDSIIAVVNTDMLGRTDTLHQKGEPYLYAIGSARATPHLRSIQEAVNTLCCKWIFDYRYDDPKDPLRLFYRSDHYAFAKHGVPAVFYFGGLHEDYHGTGDDVEKLEPERLRRAAVFVAALAWTLANL
ncbi:MAG: M28 family peptidase [Bacteroidia bacterium]|nr:M28 family peptidase [Bacteroidia bacterium]